MSLTLNRHFLRAIRKTDENTVIVFNQGAWFSTYRLNTTEDGVKELFERSTKMIIEALKNVRATFFLDIYFLYTLIVLPKVFIKLMKTSLPRCGLCIQS